MDNNEQTLLRLGLDRKAHTKLHDVLERGLLTDNTQIIWDAQLKFYQQFDVTGITDLGAFTTWVAEHRLTQIKATDPDRFDLIQSLIGKLRGPIDMAMVPALTNTYLQQSLASDALTAIEQFQNPDNEEDLDQLLLSATDKYKDKLERTTVSPIEDTSLDDLYAQDAPDYGFKWRLPELQRGMRRLRPGDALVWAARPDRGKTTTVASEMSYMIPQMDDVYPDENRSFIWFNNEGDSRSVRRRLYQSMLGITGSQMLEYHKDGTLLTRLHEACGGEDMYKRVMVMSIHGYSSTQVMRLIKEHKPGLVVFDMVDNIRFSGLTTNGGTRTDQLLEEMYKWARDAGIIERFAVISTSQISGDGENMQYPLMSMLKDSKTGKQGACDAIVMWGEQSGNQRGRFLGIPKNKLALEGQPSNPKVECYFMPEIARIVSIEDVQEE